jgi:hypothetical protein
MTRKFSETRSASVSNVLVFCESFHHVPDAGLLGSLSCTADWCKAFPHPRGGNR